MSVFTKENHNDDSGKNFREKFDSVMNENYVALSRNKASSPSSTSEESTGLKIQTLCCPEHVQ